MTLQERTKLIESYGHAYPLLQSAIKQFPREMWQFKPSPDRWSIHEIIIHLADSEANSFARCRCFVAEPGKTIMAYDQDLWASRCDYHRQSTEDALELFRLLRKMSYDLIRRLPEAAWNSTVNHPEVGAMSFEQWLVIYEEHVRKHIGQMQRDYDGWQQSR
jgi:hypothetical protein